MYELDISGVKVTHDVDALCLGTMKLGDVHLHRRSQICSNRKEERHAPFGLDI